MERQLLAISQTVSEHIKALRAEVEDECGFSRPRSAGGDSLRAFHCGGSGV